MIRKSASLREQGSSQFARDGLVSCALTDTTGVAFLGLFLREAATGIAISCAIECAPVENLPGQVAYPAVIKIDFVNSPRSGIHALNPSFTWNFRETLSEG